MHLTINKIIISMQEVTIKIKWKKYIPILFETCNLKFYLLASAPIKLNLRNIKPNSIIRGLT